MSKFLSLNKIEEKNDHPSIYLSFRKFVSGSLFAFLEADRFLDEKRRMSEACHRSLCILQS